MLNLVMKSPESLLGCLEMLLEGGKPSLVFSRKDLDNLSCDFGAELEIQVIVFAILEEIPDSQFVQLVICVSNVSELEEFISFVFGPGGSL